MSGTRNDRSDVNKLRGDDTDVDDDTHGPADRQDNDDGVDGRGFRHCGSYYVKTPDVKKRDRVQQIAREEAEHFHHYKESQTCNHFSTTPQRTGGRYVSEEEARRKQQRESQHSQTQQRYDAKMKKQQWEEENRAREDAELNEKKAKARRQAERNAMKLEHRQVELDKRRQIHNEQWMQKQTSQGFAHTPSGALQQLTEIFPGKEERKLNELLLKFGSVQKVIDILI